MPGDDRESPPGRAPRVGSWGHPPLAGFFGEVQESSHRDLGTKAARRPNILSSFGKAELDLRRRADDPSEPDELEDRGFVGFS